MTPTHLTTAEAAEALGLTVHATEDLVAAGFLRLEAAGIPRSEVKSFQARNSWRPGETLSALGEVDHGAEDILDALEAAIPNMAHRITELARQLFRQTDTWTAEELDELELANQQRFAAILAATRSKRNTEDLLVDLLEQGGAAAFAGAELPQILAVLRLSRDLLVQAAIGAAEELGQEWGLALAVVLTRVLPVQDQLADTVARGYWGAVLTREQEAFARYEHVVEHSASGVYEVDLEGRLQYLNPRMSVLCAVERNAAIGLHLIDILRPVAPAPAALYRTPTVSGWRPVQVVRNDGVTRDVLIQITVRTREGQPIGYDGIVRDVTAETALERQKNDFLGHMTEELRAPLSSVLDASDALRDGADASTVRAAGASIREDVERIGRLADDLHDISLLRSAELTVTTRPTSLRSAADEAIARLGVDEDVRVEADPSLWVIADHGRLTQVLTHLLENALRHGAPPVEVRATPGEGIVRVDVTDHGVGVPADHVPQLFSELRPTVPDDRLRDRRSGLGLPLASGLIEAMGGRIDYARADHGGARFIIHLPTA